MTTTTKTIRGEPNGEMAWCWFDESPTRRRCLLSAEARTLMHRNGTSNTVRGPAISRVTVTHGRWYFRRANQPVERVRWSCLGRIAVGGFRAITLPLRDANWPTRTQNHEQMRCCRCCCCHDSAQWRRGSEFVKKRFIEYKTSSDK